MRFAVFATTLHGLTHVRPMQEELMRAAAFAAGALVAAGAYLAIATVFAFGAAAIGIGVLVIALVTAVAIVLGDRQPAPATSGTLADPFDFA